MMRRWLPHPVFFVALVILWLIFSASLHLGSLLVGVLLSGLLCKLLDLLEPPRVYAGSYLTMATLTLRVAFDITLSNIKVAWILLKPSHRRLHSGFVTIPLQLTDIYGLSVLALIITSTPGTVWASHDPGSQSLIIHVLNLRDPQAVIDTIKQRYEKPLLEIFQ